MIMMDLRYATIGFKYHFPGNPYTCIMIAFANSSKFICGVAFFRHYAKIFAYRRCTYTELGHQSDSVDHFRVDTTLVLSLTSYGHTIATLRSTTRIIHTNKAK